MGFGIKNLSNGLITKPMSPTGRAICSLSNASLGRHWDQTIALPLTAKDHDLLLLG